METLDALTRRLATTEDLQAIVRTMKSLAAASITQYERAEAALEGFVRTVDLALSHVLRSLPAEEPTALTPRVLRTGTVVIGSDHGLCGRFNEQVAHRAIALRKEQVEQGPIMALGARVLAVLEAEGVGAELGPGLPGTVAAMSSVVDGLILQIDDWRAQQHVQRVVLVHNRRGDGATAIPTVVELLPLSRARIAELLALPWPSGRVALHPSPPLALLEALVRQDVFVTLYRAVVQSLASEHASRLAAMQAAERNMRERIEELRTTWRQMRQEAITTELLDVVAGFESLQTEETCR